jgi:hypothetical protein
MSGHDRFIKPQIADQVALGYFKTLKTICIPWKETYYKEVQNRLDYIDGANLIANKAIEQIILNGQLRSYGLEILLRKNEGKLNGWISYTLSKSEQQTPGRTAQELELTMVNGTILYDKLHNIAITSSYNLNEKWSFGLILLYKLVNPSLSSG